MVRVVRVRVRVRVRGQLIDVGVAVAGLEVQYEESFVAFRRRFELYNVHLHHLLLHHLHLEPTHTHLHI